MFFLLLGIIETFATYLIIIIMAISRSFDILAIILMFIGCIFWFSLYAMWKRIKSQKQELKLLKNSLNECRKKLNLTPLEEKEIKNQSNNPFSDF